MSDKTETVVAGVILKLLVIGILCFLVDWRMALALYLAVTFF